MNRPVGIGSGRSDRYNTGDPTIGDIIAGFERRLQRLESGGGKGNTSIDSGQLTLKAGATLIVRRQVDDGIVARIGSVDGGTKWGVEATNPNIGTTPAQLFIAGASEPGGDSEDGVVNIVDRQGDIIQSLGGNWGFDSPEFDYQFAPTSVHATPTQSTTSGTFAAMWTVYGYAYHPWLRLSYLVQNDVGTTSEVRARDTWFNNPITDSLAYASGAFQYDTISLEHKNDSVGNPPSAGFLFKVDLDMRRVSGAGVARIQLLSVNGFG